MRTATGVPVFSDGYVDRMFEGKDFGEKINASTDSKMEFLAETLELQERGYWCGSTGYDLIVKMGLIVDGKAGTNKVLTPKGEQLVRLRAHICPHKWMTIGDVRQCQHSECMEVEKLSEAAAI